MLDLGRDLADGGARKELAGGVRQEHVLGHEETGRDAGERRENGTLNIVLSGGTHGRYVEWCPGRSALRAGALDPIDLRTVPGYVLRKVVDSAMGAGDVAALDVTQLLDGLGERLESRAD